MSNVIISKNSQFVNVSPLWMKTQIGRSPDCDIVLEGTGISRVHACIQNQEGQYYLIDEHSTNGTFFEDQQVNSLLLSNGTSFRIQDYLLTFVEDFHTQEGEASDGMATATLIDPGTGTTPESLWPAQQMPHKKSLQQKVSRLLKLITDLNAIPDNAAPAGLFADALLDITWAKRAIVAIRHDPDESITLHSRGFSDEDKEQKTSQRIAQKMVKNGAIVHQNHAHMSNSATDDADVQIESVLCVPLKSGADVIGCIYLDHPDVPKVFSETDRDLLVSTAEQITDILLSERRQSNTLSFQDEQMSGDLKKQGIIARSPKTVKIFRDCQAIAQYNVSVLIFGETGTGKEVIARYIHDQSGRKGKFIARNCSAIPAPMIESEVFGHEKGAFTGAVDKKPGILELAHGGTLFLDEIGDMPSELQAKLLRTLQDKEVWRLGGRVPIQTDVRIIAATHKDIKNSRKELDFRDDLYYRLANVEITAPNLRDRPEDIAPLCELFLQTFCDENPDKNKAFRISPKALRLLEAYDWPGNIRELNNTLIQIGFKCNGTTIEPSHLKGLIDVFATTAEHPDTALPSLLEVERNHIVKVMEHTSWNKTAAAKVLSIDRNRLNRRLKALRIKS